MKLNPVFFTQKKVLRAISFEHFTSPSTHMFSNFKILKLQDFFQLKLLTFLYEGVKKISPTYFHSFFIQFDLFINTVLGKLTGIIFS